MSRQAIERLEHALLANFSSLRKDIENCPDSVWEKKYGGDYIWQQALHTLAVNFMLMNEPGIKHPDLPESTDVLLMHDDSYKGDHSRELILKTMDTVLEHLSAYLDKKNDEDLYKDANFFGNSMPFFDILMIANGHIMYHLGVFDAALRENGAKTAL